MVKEKKIFFNILMLFLLFFGIGLYSANADLKTDNEVYYSFDNDNLSSSNPLDLSGNNNNGTNNGATTGQEGILKEAFEYSGAEYVNSNYGMNIGTSESFSMCAWFNSSDTSTGQKILIGSLHEAGTNDPIISMGFGATGTQFPFAQFRADDGSNYVVDNTTTYNDNSYHFMCSVLDRSTNTLKLYIDEVLLESVAVSSSDSFSINANYFFIGAINLRGSPANYFAGVIDETSIYNRTLSSFEIGQLYNNGTGFNPYAFQGAEITFNNPQQGDYLNNTNFTLNVSFSLITNSTYQLNNGSILTLGTNENESVLNLTGIEGINNLTVFTNTSGFLDNSSINFTIDTINPTINNSLPSEINSYNLNISNFVSCSDVNLLTCNITLENVSISSSVESYNFTTNGNQSYNIIATDLAGNSINESGVIFVNPNQIFYFEDSGATPLTNFYIDGVLYSNNYTFKVYDFPLGNNSIEFVKDGYQTQNINFVTNTTSNLNVSFVIQDASIIVYIRDQETNNLLTGVNFTAEFIATVGATTSTTTGIINITNTLFQNENYQVVISNVDYQTESINFDFTNREEIVLTAYMINKSNPNLGVVFVKAVDNFGKGISGATVKALQWDSSQSQYKEVSTAITGSDGLGTLNVILNDKVYLFTALKDGVTGQTTASEIIDDTENGKTVTIPLVGVEQEYSYLLENVIVSVSESFNEITNISTITFDYASSIGAIDICINEYIVVNSNERLETEDCITGTSGTYQVQYIINNSYLTVLKGEIKVDGVTYTIKSFAYQPQGSIDEVLGDLGLATFILPLLMMGSVAVAFLVQNVYIGSILMFIMSGLSLVLIPDTLTKGIVAFIGFVCWVTIALGVKSK